MDKVEGKVAFVTGGASGLGLAMARSFSRAGMKIVVADVEDDALTKVEQEFSGSNSFLALKVDVTDRDALTRAADETERHFGKVHVLCNNAGVAVGGNIQEMSYMDWDWVMNVNLQGVINGVQTFIPRIVKHGEGGHIVNTASMAGQIALPGLSVYSVTKYAVVGMSETMREDLVTQNIGVSVLCPGVVNTNIHSSGRNRPEQLKGATDTAGDLLSRAGADPEHAAQLRALVANSLDPAKVGDMVLDAIRKNDAYIFTHPEMRGAVEMRYAGILGSFDRWRQYRAES